MLFEEEAEPSYLADPVLDMPTAGSSEPSQAAAATGQMEAPLKI